MKPSMLILVFMLIVFSNDCYSGQADNGLFVFVGRLIDIHELKDDPCGEPESEDGEERICISMDSGFQATYEILEPFYGKYESAQITFEAYDHYGWPAFSRFNHALMFVHVTNEGNYHAKYQFFDVYQAIDGRWATCSDSLQNDEDAEMSKKPAFSVAKFPESLVFADAGRFRPAYVAKEYPSEFFEIRAGKVFCKEGVYAEDLLDYKERTVLKSRGIVLDPSMKARRGANANR